MELLTLVDYGVSVPAITGAYFPNTISSDYWSSTPYAGFTTAAWSVLFYNGYTYGNGKAFTVYVRCVRGQ